MALSSALPLPRASAYDPPFSDEGRLDPLGLGSIADRIADTYARPVRARMRRVRFLSVMSVGGLFIPELAGVEPAVAGDTPDVAFERVVVECLARSSSSEMHLDSGIPGVTKAHAALLSKSRLSARGYLKSPRVFGFFGIYRPLAGALGLNDRSAGTLEPGVRVLEGVETDLDLPGLSKYSRGTPGTALVEWLERETTRALETGSNAFPASSQHVKAVAHMANPGTAGTKERKALRELLTNPMASAHPQDEESYLEVLRLIGVVDPDGWGDLELVTYLLDKGSDSLRARMELLLEFEEFSRDLTWAFTQYRYLASHALGRVCTALVLAQDAEFTSVALGIGQRYQRVIRKMESAIDFGVDPNLLTRFRASFEKFGEVSNASEFLDLVMNHHSAVQKGKAPAGKRPWLEESGKGWEVRPMFMVSEKPERLESFVHPYRLTAMANFLEDTHV
jgi:hypothetical protein